MFSSVRRDVIALLIGAAIGALFGILVAYPEMLASTRENAAHIKANEHQIQLLWNAHSIEHPTLAPDEGPLQ